MYITWTMQPQRDFQPLQVVNRDLSAAVLRHFIKVREQELSTGTLKKRKTTRGAPPAPKQQKPEPGQPVSKHQVLAIGAEGYMALPRMMP